MDIWKIKVILPEHRERMKADAQKKKLKERPHLDEQERQLIDEIIGQSMHDKEPVTLVIYGQYEDRYVKGIVRRVDVVTRRLLINEDWVKLSDVIGVK